MNLLLEGRKFIPLRVDPVSDGRQNNFDRITSPERVPIPVRQQALYKGVGHLS